MSKRFDEISLQKYLRILFTKKMANKIKPVDFEIINETILKKTPKWKNKRSHGRNTKKTQSTNINNFFILNFIEFC